MTILFGAWLLSGRAEKLAAALAALGALALAGLVVSIRPAALVDPLGGISKNLGLLACALVVVLLSDRSPLARRAARKSARRRS